MENLKQTFIDKINEDTKKFKKEYHEIAFKMAVAKILSEYLNNNDIKKNKLAELLEIGETRLSNILKGELNLSIKSIADILTKIDYQHDFIAKNITNPIAGTPNKYSMTGPYSNNRTLIVADNEKTIFKEKI